MLGSIESRLPQRSVVAIDLLVVLWTVSSLVLGITVGTFVDRTGRHRREPARDGSGDPSSRRRRRWALRHAGRRRGVRIARRDEIHTIGTETAEHGLAVEQDIHRLAVLIGVGLAAGPTIPVLVILGATTRFA